MVPGLRFFICKHLKEKFTLEYEYKDQTICGKILKSFKLSFHQTLWNSVVQCVFIRFYITTQPGPVKLVSLAARQRNPALSSKSFYATRIDPPKCLCVCLWIQVMSLSPSAESFLRRLFYQYAKDTNARSARILTEQAQAEVRGHHLRFCYVRCVVSLLSSTFLCCLLIACFIILYVPPPPPPPNQPTLFPYFSPNTSLFAFYT